MEQDKRRILPASDIDKAASKLLKSAVISLTQMTEDGVATGCFCRKVIQLKPAQVTSFQYGAIHDIIRAKIPLAPDCIVKVCDAFITTYPNEVFMHFMEFANLRNATDYQSEQYDCDDFSVTFCATARRWHAKLRTQIESVASVKQMLPAAPPAPVNVRVIPHTPAGAPSVPAAAAAAADAQYIGGAPIGLCHGKLSASSGEHAFNFWISPKGEVVFIEPQTGEFITFGEGAVIDFIYI
jgi:hypothetical protein